MGPQLRFTRGNRKREPRGSHGANRNSVHTGPPDHTTEHTIYHTRLCPTDIGEQLTQSAATDPWISLQGNNQPQADRPTTQAPQTVRPTERPTARGKASKRQRRTRKADRTRPADPRIVIGPNDGRPSVNDFYLDSTFEKALDAAGIDPKSRADWRPVIEWLADGFNSQQICEAIEKARERNPRVAGGLVEVFQQSGSRSVARP